MGMAAFLLRVDVIKKNDNVYVFEYFTFIDL